LNLDELANDAQTFRGRHLLMYSLNVHLDYRFERCLRRWCGVIPDRLRQLESARFNRLHHGVQCLGITCHDVLTGRRRYFWSGLERGPGLSDVVRASASIPRLFPPVPVAWDEHECRLTDGGVSDPVPVAFARHPSVGATHVIVSDCRWIGDVPKTDRNT